MRYGGWQDKIQVWSSLDSESPLPSDPWRWIMSIMNKTEEKYESLETLILTFFSMIELCLNELKW